MRHALISLAFILSACGAPGTLTFTTWGEAYIEEGIPVDSMATTGFVDGWSLKYSKFVVVLKDITLAQKTGGKGPKQGGAKVVDLTKKGPVDVLTFKDAPAGKWDLVSYAIAPDAAPEGIGGIAAADVEAAKNGAFSIHLVGTATKGATTKTFDWSFTNDTLYADCTNPDFGEGVTIPTGGTEVVQLTIHGDHFWYDDLQAATAKLRFQAMADADANADSVITQAELKAVQLTSLPLGQYGTGGASSVKSLYDFAAALSRTIGHYRGEGHCESTVR